MTRSGSRKLTVRNVSLNQSIRSKQYSHFCAERVKCTDRFEPVLWVRKHVSHMDNESQSLLTAVGLHEVVTLLAWLGATTSETCITSLDIESIPVTISRFLALKVSSRKRGHDVPDYSQSVNRFIKSTQKKPPDRSSTCGS